MQPIDNEYEHNRLLAGTVFAVIAVVFVTIFLVAAITAVQATKRAEICAAAEMQWYDGDCVSEVAP